MKEREERDKTWIEILNFSNMADTSPGKVQALRAMFAEHDTPVMGAILPSGKLGARPWKHSLSPLCQDTAPQMEPAVNGTAIPEPKNGSVKPNGDKSCDKFRKVPLKPIVGPKPFCLMPPNRTVLSPTLNLAPNSRQNGERLANKRDEDVSRKNYDTIASFMFVNSNEDTVSHKDGEKPLPNPETSSSNCNSLRVEPEQKADSKLSSCLSLISSDNYICKSAHNVIRNELPPKEKIGPPPLKPVKPLGMKLPERYLHQSPEKKNSAPPKPARSSLSPIIPALPLIRKPNYPCPPRPTTSPPVPPQGKPRLKDLHSEVAQDDELYGDTLLDELSQSPALLTSLYTDEQELYDDAEDMSDAYVLKPKPLPPLPPLPSHDSGGEGITDLLYDDINEQNTDEEYECPAEKNQENHYANNRHEIERVKRDEKLMRKVEKEKERREKEFHKIKKKFGLTGEELPINAGLVKADCRGGRNDLQVKRGEIVHILRIEGNPPGKWLARNKKGKYGYVELTNIEVMTIRRCSLLSASDELYSEANSDEGIYELTY